MQQISSYFKLILSIIVGTYENNQTANVIFPRSFFLSRSIVFTSVSAKFVSVVSHELRVISFRET